MILYIILLPVIICIEPLCKMLYKYFKYGRKYNKLHKKNNVRPFKDILEMKDEEQDK